MSKIRKIFWTVSLVTIILIVCLDLFYFGFKNTKARECGNAIMQSCYELGFAYHNEIEGVKKDTATALKYLEKACNGKYAQGCQYLGMITADSQKSVNYYDSACDYGSLDSCYTLGLLYENQTMKNLSKSLSYFINLCEQNYKNSCFRTALLYSKYDAPNDIKDYKKALSIFDNFCDKNDYASCYAAGWMYYDGKIESLEKIAKSMDYFTKSCEGGYVYGCYSIDMHERELKKFEENQRLCDNGSAEHCNKVAYEYKRGRTVQNNLTKAAEYYSKACDEYDDAQSCEEAYLTYGQYDLVNKMKYAKKACERKIYKACIDVGDLYLHIYEYGLDYRLAYIQNPDILPKDPKKALYYYKKAYENGIDYGYYKAGLVYYREKEIYDLKSAEKFFKITCDKNEGHGCFYLSEVYVKNNNMQNAMIYAKKGCDLKHTSSCNQQEWLEKKLNK